MAKANKQYIDYSKYHRSLQIMISLTFIKTVLTPFPTLTFTNTGWCALHSDSVSIRNWTNVIYVP